MECLASRQSHGVSYIYSVYIVYSINTDLVPPTERELIGTFLLEMADRQVITARTEWYVDKTKMRQMFEAHLASQSKCGEMRIKLSLQGAWNVSNSALSENEGT